MMVVMNMLYNINIPFNFTSGRFSDAESDTSAQIEPEADTNPSFNLSTWHCPISINNILAHGVKESCVETVNRALVYGADPKMELAYSTLFGTACRIGDLPIVKLLMNYGADIDAFGRNHWECPLNQACIAGKHFVVEELIKKNATINRYSGYYFRTPLETAIEYKQPLCCSLLLSAKASINYINRYTNSTPLIKAIEGNSLEIVQILLKGGADPNFCARTSPLFHAVKSPEIVKELIDYRANIHWDSKRCETSPVGTQAIHVAAGVGNYETVELLLNAGADRLALDQEYRTPYCLAWCQLDALKEDLSDQGQLQRTVTLLENRATASLQKSARGFHSFSLAETPMRCEGLSDEQTENSAESGDLTTVALQALTPDAVECSASLSLPFQAEAAMTCKNLSDEYSESSAESGDLTTTAFEALFHYDSVGTLSFDSGLFI